MKENKGIIRSILDTDLYKLSMMWFVLDHYYESDAVYKFNNRNKNMKFTEESVSLIRENIQHMSELRLSNDEYNWMKDNLYFLPITFRQYLSAYRFNPDQIKLTLIDGDLDIEIRGKWRDTILWEVPLMSIISEIYFKIIDTDWDMSGQVDNIVKKSILLNDNNCNFTDFGSRRRRNFETQDLVVDTMRKYSNFMGTSNPYLSMKYNVKSLGTCAHESIGAVSVLESLNHPNKYFMEKWSDTYNGSLGIMLPDTYGTDSFLLDFTLEKAKLWDGVRHDSGDPYEFTDKIINHYNKLGIDPLSKVIIFSDGLDDKLSVKLNNYCKNKIKCSFGIGTFFTSDFKKVSEPTEKSLPMNMVIKLVEIDGIPVVKISDSPGKSIGDVKMLEIMKYIHFKNYL